MNNKIKLAVVPFLLALGACSSSSSTAPAGGGATLQVITTSDTFMDLDGTYNICYARSNGGVLSTLDEVVISGSSFSMTSQDYSLAGCSAPIDGADSAAAGIVSIATPGVSNSVTDWVDGSDVSTTPPTASAGGALSETASYTLLSVTFSGTPTGNFSSITVGTPVSIFYVVDATVSGVAPILYRDSDADAGVASTADPLTKAP
ncbi:hypothetical protein MNBD_GAMMA08-2250 [hydrothermal vent metagenome]|uniref:Lipoprotein n=1 Tax=hydrothermal vent metagenome TaxID=652676 RepID=A0A3B0XEL1_9ZZZZ